MVNKEGRPSIKAGFVGLVGQPNAGKSTLMNFLIREKVSIVNSKPQTTRRRQLGIYSNDEGQIVFVDAPGIVRANKGLNAFLEAEAKSIIEESDVLIAVLNLDEKAPEDLEEILKLVSNSGKKWIPIITKIDLAKLKHRLPTLENMISKYKKVDLNEDILKIGNDAGVDERQEIHREIFKILPISTQPLFDPELFTPETTRNLSAEIIREKCFEFLHQEIPYGLAVQILKFDETANPCPRIEAEIIIAKENHKPIVVGKKGEMLKQIGTEARKDIEKLLGEKVFLSLNVKCRPDWYLNPKEMKELGYVIPTK